MRQSKQSTDASDEARHTLPRRRILMLIPAMLMTAVTTTFAAAAFRFLRPQQATDSLPNPAGEDSWTPVAPVADLNGSQPMMRKVSVEHQAGWSTMRQEHSVFILPQQNLQVVSAICPHEGCEVDWNDETREFLCPCHDSHFDAGGARRSGPAQNGLTAIPCRLKQGILEVQYRPVKLEIENNSSTVN